MEFKGKTSEMENFLVGRSPLLLKRIKRAVPDCDEKVMLKNLCMFLTLTQCGHSLTPSAKVDAVWHELILFTQLYSEFCETHLGAFVHHSPDENSELNDQRYKQTIALLKEHFGVIDKNIWPYGVSTETICGTCST